MGWFLKKVFRRPRKKIAENSGSNYFQNIRLPQIFLKFFTATLISLKYRDCRIRQRYKVRENLDLFKLYWRMPNRQNFAAISTVN